MASLLAEPQGRLFFECDPNSSDQLSPHPKSTRQRLSLKKSSKISLLGWLESGANPVSPPLAPNQLPFPGMEHSDRPDLECWGWPELYGLTYRRNEVCYQCKGPGFRAGMNSCPPRTSSQAALWIPALTVVALRSDLPLPENLISPLANPGFNQMRSSMRRSTCQNTPLARV